MFAGRNGRPTRCLMRLTALGEDDPRDEWEGVDPGAVYGRDANGLRASAHMLRSISFQPWWVRRFVVR